MDEGLRPLWDEFKRRHPHGTPVSGRVTRAEPFGVFVDLGVPFEALLLVPYLRPLGTPRHFPADYPRAGEAVDALIRHYGDDVTPEGVGTIALTQAPESLWVTG